MSILVVIDRVDCLTIIELLYYSFSGFLLILLIESVVHKFFGGHGHSHFPSQETLAKKFVAVEVSQCQYTAQEMEIANFISMFETQDENRKNKVWIRTETERSF